MAQTRPYLNFGELVAFLIDSYHNLVKGIGKEQINKSQVYNKKYKIRHKNNSFKDHMDNLPDLQSLSHWVAEMCLSLSW